ncbi:MAG: PD-(D/E)XK nuclease family protein [Candidatus Aenigmarchaeota archaeon]|nr:PD-(D/E)XK nuclease family protein [Candidatus Aenigmarchaeota archaeon]
MQNGTDSSIDDFTNNLTPDLTIDFNQMIDNYLHREFKPKSEGTYYPSEIGSCIRKVWYTYKFPKQIDPKLKKIFEVGNMMHEFVVKVLQSEKNPHIELVSTELPFKREIEDFLISGRIDNVILVKADGRQLLIEVKSAKDIGWIREPKPENVVQLQLYMHVTGIHDGALLYINKSDLESKVFPIRYDSKAAEDVETRFRNLNQHIRVGLPPEPEARGNLKTQWMCRYCEYKEKCYVDTPKDGRWV